MCVSREKERAQMQSDILLGIYHVVGGINSDILPEIYHNIGGMTQYQ
jgi:hypothetical protein